jgi:hypothetical protein
MEETWKFAVIGYASNDVPAYLGFANDLEGAEKLRDSSRTTGWHSVAVLDSTLREIVPLKRVFDAVAAQILNGKTYLAVSKALLSLLDTDLGVFQEAPTFFGMTAAGGMELAQMTIARLYDLPGRTKRPVTIRSMLEQAKREISSFQFGDEKQVSDAIAAALSAVNELEPILSAIRRRRNEWLAHLDVRTVADPQELNERAKLTVPDLERVFQETEKIFASLERLFDGVIGENRYLGGADYKNVFNLIRLAQAAEKKELAAVLQKQAKAGT